MTASMMLVAGVGFVDAIGRSLRESFFMFWQTLWPLVLGFSLAGVVQAFVSRESLQAKLGDHGPAAVARASGYGMASSSCSYAASAMAKSLFVKGADFVAATVFMFASTNLVVELGIVLIALMGWQFAASEFVGGVIMICLLASLGGLWLRGRLVVEARQHLAAGSHDAPGSGHAPGLEDSHGAHMAHQHEHGSENDLAVSDNGHGGHLSEGNVALPDAPFGKRLRSKQGWVDAASYTVADLTMLRRELLVGFTVAGFLAVLVPSGLWNAVFVHGHGFATTLENAVVGPFIAIISFVCSIGNVPLAAALWKGGISFGGVVSFLFADLISFPLLLVYRRYYGTRIMLRMLVTFWAVMSAAGLATEEIFRAAGLVPKRHTGQIVPAHFSWDYTTFLNIVFLLVIAICYFAYRNRARLGGSSGYAIDPVCGMQVEKDNAPARSVAGATVHYFCSDHCRMRFELEPGRFSTEAERP